MAWQVTGIFENVGVVQEGMITIAKPHTLVDKPGCSSRSHVTRGEVLFDNVRFGYGRESALLDGLTLNVKPGEKIGLVGRSGAGKSTVVNLLLRFFEVEGGRILIDGQDIATVTQESLRTQVSVVTQDTSLLHRSIRDNIRYGKPGASEAEIVAAAQMAHAHDFILDLEDRNAGSSKGYGAHVGERGVKLSGGQRQRVAIARVILKDAPILVLDEATSALDSEVEAAIQSSLDVLMRGKTVVAIAHRLSTIARMDRLVIMDKGQIVEQGTHDSLLRQVFATCRPSRPTKSGGFDDQEAVNNGHRPVRRRTGQLSQSSGPATARDQTLRPGTSSPAIPSPPTPSRNPALSGSIISRRTAVPPTAADKTRSVQAFAEPEGWTQFICSPTPAAAPGYRTTPVCPNCA